MCKKTRFRNVMVCFVLTLFMAAPLHLMADSSDANENPFLFKEKSSENSRYGFGDNIFVNDEKTVAWSKFRWETHTSEAFMYKDNVVTRIGKEISDNITVIGINKKGDILYSAQTGLYPNTETSGYLYAKGQSIKLEKGDTESCFPKSMNNSGDIIGYCQTAPPEKRKTLYLWNDKGRVALDNAPIDQNAYSIPALINNQKQIAFSSNKGAYLLDNDRIFEIKASDPALGVKISDLNDKGQLIGYFMDYSTFQYSSFLWEKETLTELGGMGSYKSSSSSKINKRGQIIGSARNSANQVKPFLYDNQRLTDLSGGYERTFAFAINKKGEIAGTIGISKYTSAIALWKKGYLHNLGIMEGTNFCSPTAINKKGHIVGHCDAGNWNFEFFLWKKGTFINLTKLANELP